MSELNNTPSDGVIRTVLFRDGKIVGRLVRKPREGRTVYTYLVNENGVERVRTMVFGPLEEPQFLASLGGTVEEKPSFLLATSWAVDNHGVKINLVHNCNPQWNQVLVCPMADHMWKVDPVTGLTAQLIRKSAANNCEFWVANWGKIRV